MRDEWTEYLKSVGFREPLLGRAAKTFRFYREFVGFEIQTIFVSEYLDNSGQRQYEALWVFSDKAVGEAKFRGPEERIDLIPLENNIVHWIVEKTAFEFDGTATEASRLTLRYRLGEGQLMGIMKASGTNCLRLADILRKFITPALRQN